MSEMLFIRTPDLDLAAALNSIGHTVHGISKTFPNNTSNTQYVFLFENSQKVEEDISRIRNKEARHFYQIEPLDVLYARKILLQRLKETNYGNGNTDTGN